MARTLSYRRPEPASRFLGPQPRERSTILGGTIDRRQRQIAAGAEANTRLGGGPDDPQFLAGKGFSLQPLGFEKTLATQGRGEAGNATFRERRQTFFGRESGPAAGLVGPGGLVTGRIRRTKLTPGGVARAPEYRTLLGSGVRL